ncbi:hypothetical protein V6N13_080128 [Hibiscus sabdariffa]
MTPKVATASSSAKPPELGDLAPAGCGGHIFTTLIKVSFIPALFVLYGTKGVVTLSSPGKPSSFSSSDSLPKPSSASLYDLQSLKDVYPVKD